MAHESSSRGEHLQDVDNKQAMEWIGNLPEVVWDPNFIAYYEKADPEAAKRFMEVRNKKAMAKEATTWSNAEMTKLAVVVDDLMKTVKENVLDLSPKSDLRIEAGLVGDAINLTAMGLGGVRFLQDDEGVFRFIGANLYPDMPELEFSNLEAFEGPDAKKVVEQVSKQIGDIYNQYEELAVAENAEREVESEADFRLKLAENPDLYTQISKNKKGNSVVNISLPTDGDLQYSRIQHFVGPGENLPYSIPEEKLGYTKVMANGISYSWQDKTWKDKSGQRLLVYDGTVIEVIDSPDQRIIS